MTAVLPPLDPARDYSRGAQERDFRKSIGWTRPAAHRAVDIPYWTAPAGYCRWCGNPTGAQLKSGALDTRVRWHPRCATEWQNLQPDAQRRRTWRRALGECATCGRFCPERRPYDRDRHANPWRRWAADHIVPLIDGGANDDANLQLLCEPCHKEKTAREATQRAAARRVNRMTPQQTLFSSEGATA